MRQALIRRVALLFFRLFPQRRREERLQPRACRAFINKGKEVKIGDKVINPKGSLLTLSAQEAVRNMMASLSCAQGVASNLEELCEKAGLRAKDIVRVEPTGFERLAQWITVLAPLFLVGGMIGAYLEFKSPGFGVAGILYSGLCFLLFFAGHYIAGLTGFEVVAVFILGTLLVLTELLFSGCHPSCASWHGIDGRFSSLRDGGLLPKPTSRFSLDLLFRPSGQPWHCRRTIRLGGFSSRRAFYLNFRFSTGWCWRRKARLVRRCKCGRPRCSNPPSKSARKGGPDYFASAGKAEFGAALVRRGH